MKLVKDLTSLLFVGFLGLSGCVEDNKEQVSKRNYIAVSGKPLSVVGYAHENHSYLSVVVNFEGKNILGKAYPIWSEEAFDALAIIQSEINDGDNDKIELRGNYSGNSFNITSFSANGYDFYFKKR